jgi:hypothetical protein
MDLRPSSKRRFVVSSKEVAMITFPQTNKADTQDWLEVTRNVKLSAYIEDTAIVFTKIVFDTENRREDNASSRKK